MIEGVCAKLGAAPDLLHSCAVDHIQPESEPLTHFSLPLVEKWAGRGDDQDAVRKPPRHEFCEYQPGLDGLAQANRVRQQQPDPAHANGTKDGHELVRFQAKPTRLNRQQRVRP